MSISIEAHRQYIKYLSWPSDNVLRSIITFVRSWSAFSRFCWFPQLPQKQYVAFSFELSLYTNYHLSVEIMPTNNSSVHSEICVRCSDRRRSQREMSWVTVVAKGAISAVLGRVLETNSLTHGLRGHRKKTVPFSISCYETGFSIEDDGGADQATPCLCPYGQGSLVVAGCRSRYPDKWSRLTPVALLLTWFKFNRSMDK